MRLGKVAALLLALGLFWAPARADEDASIIRAQAWSLTGELPLLLADDELLYVARSGSEHARTFVRIEIDGLLSDAVDSAVLQLAEGGDELSPDNAAISVCALTSPLQSTGRIDPASAPESDCRIQTFAVRSPNGLWSVDLRPFLDQPELAAHGLAIFPDATDPRPAAATFRVSFDPRVTTVVTTTASTVPQRAPSGADTAPVDSLPTTQSSATAPPIAPASPSTPAGGSVGATSGSSRGADDVVESAAPPSGSDASTVGGITATVAPLVNTPPWQLLPAGALVAGAVAALGASLAARRARSERPVRVAGARWSGAVAATVALLAVPAVASESLVFDLGLVLIFAVGVLGLHVLVHWAGQFSLAHAASIGVPAFVVARLADAWNTSSLHLVPVAVVVGVMVSAVLAAVSSRASTYTVTVATLAIALGADRYLFTNPLLVGAGTVTVPAPELLVLRFGSSRSLWVPLVVLTLLAFAATAALGSSELGRRIRWSHRNPAGAAAAGIHPRLAIASAYLVAGALAGLAGGLTVIWVGTVGSQSFPLALAFDMFIVAVVAGAGSVLAVAGAAFLFEGIPALNPLTGPVAAYGGPLLLLLVLVHFPGGLNEAWRNLMERRPSPWQSVPAVLDGAGRRRRWSTLRPLTALGATAIALGFGAIALAWYHAGNTDQVWIQTQELISGGIGGLGLIVFGTGLLLADHLRALRHAVERSGEAPSRRDDAETDVTATPHRSA
ncbi:MAG TPA: hypothetical protein VMN58_13415 [Acidimicrobiales bacterium]|nr:hypothetical protein [Acidimicrobiales bacterium]